MGQCHYCGTGQGIYNIKGLLQGKACDSCNDKTEKLAKIKEENKKKEESR